MMLNAFLGGPPTPTGGRVVVVVDAVVVVVDVVVVVVGARVVVVVDVVVVVVDVVVVVVEVVVVVVVVVGARVVVVVGAPWQPPGNALALDTSLWLDVPADDTALTRQGMVGGSMAS